MGDRARAAAAAVVLLAATAGVGGAAPAPDPAPSGVAPPGSVPAAGSTAQTDSTTAPTFDRLTIEVTVHPNGSATWTFRYERVLANASEREAFESYAGQVRGEETALFSGFREDARLLAEAGAAAANRSAVARDFRRDAFVRSGVSTDFSLVTLTFRWDGFARTDGDRVIAGDVFEGGLYLGPGEEFVVRAGADLAFAAVDPPTTQSDPESLRDSRSVAREGEREFLDRRPRVAFEPASTPTPEPTATPEPTPTATPTRAAGGGPGPGRVALAVLLLAGLAGAVGLAARRRTGGRGTGAGTGAGAPGDGSGSGGPPGGAGTGAGDPAGGAADGAGAGAAGAGAAAAAGAERAQSQAQGEGADRQPDGTRPRDRGAAGGAGPEGESDPALLPDEERVVRLLEANGGRMRQVRIVEETGWSKSKVSVTLSEMAEDGTVSKLRIGRENVVGPEGEGPGAADSSDGDG